MSRRRGAAQDPGVSLFPFLAVLICLIGALILMLLLVSREIRSAAIQAAADEEAARPAQATPAVEPAPGATGEEEPAAEGELDPESRLALLEMRLSDVRGRQADVSQALSDQRTQLAHIEDHIRELEDEHAQLKLAEAELDRLADAKGRDRDDQLKRLEYLRELLRDKEKALDEARKALANRPQVFAIVPYEGGHGTKRQPIYVECRADGVYLQPQNIRLTADDFDGPLGPQNPLASAVRAMSEAIILTQKTPSGATPQPYPLLVVRPDGINAYYAARVALMSWEAEFGYELVDENMPLVYPPSDPRLGSIASRAIQESRARQRQLAALAPNMYMGGGGPSGAGGAGARGGDGFARVTGMGAPRNNKPVRYTVGNGPQGIVPYQGSLPGDGEEEEPTGPNPGLIAAGEAAAAARRARAGNGAGNPDNLNPAGGPNNGDGRPGRNPAGSPDGYAGTGATGPNGAPAPGGSGGAPPGSVGSGAGGGYASRSGQAGAQQGRPQWADPNQVDAGAAQNNDGPKLGEYVEPRDAPRNATAGGSPPQNATNVNVNATPRNDRNFAGERGENWALLDYKPTSISIRREVRVLLEKDQITVLPKNAPIPMPGPTAAVVDPAVKQIQTQIRQWGIAGKNMYWRPSLVVEVTPGAEPRFEELRSLLDGSGMEIRTEEWTVVKDAPTRR